MTARRTTHQPVHMTWAMRFMIAAAILVVTVLVLVAVSVVWVILAAVIS